MLTTMALSTNPGHIICIVLTVAAETSRNLQAYVIFVAYPYVIFLYFYYYGNKTCMA